MRGRDVESTTRHACVEPAGAVSMRRSTFKRRRLSDTTHMIQRFKNAGFQREQRIHGANGLLTATGTHLSAWRWYSGSARISLKRWLGRMNVPPRRFDPTEIRKDIIHNNCEAGYPWFRVILTFWGIGLPMRTGMACNSTMYWGLTGGNSTIKACS